MLTTQKTRKTTTWLLYRPNGEWDKWNLPVAFDAHDVAKHAEHCDVWLFVPEGYNVDVRVSDAAHNFVTGPCWALWNESQNDFVQYTRNSPADMTWESYRLYVA